MHPDFRFSDKRWLALAISLTAAVLACTSASPEPVEPTATLVPSPAAQTLPSPTATATPADDIASPLPPSPTSVPSPTPEATPTPESTPTPAPTSTPSPTVTPSPTPTRVPLPNPIAVDLGEINVGNGLRQVEFGGNGDGITATSMRAGRECRVTAPNRTEGRFIYFDIDDDFIFAEAASVEITVDYFDSLNSQSRMNFFFNYDSTDPSATQGGVFKIARIVDLGNTNTWKTETFIIDDAFFANREQGEFDFRIGAHDEEICFARVTVTRTDETSLPAAPTPTPIPAPTPAPPPPPTATTVPPTATPPPPTATPTPSPPESDTELGENLVFNGDFESPDAGHSFKTYRFGQTFGGWTVESGTVDHVGLFFTAASGIQSVDLSGDRPGVIYQDLATAPGQSYLLQFALAAPLEDAPPLRQFHVWWGSQLVESVTFEPQPGNTQVHPFWVNKEFTVRAETRVTRLRFVSRTLGVFGPLIDNVSVEPIVESGG